MDTGTLNGTKEVLAERTVVASDLTDAQPATTAAATGTATPLEFMFNQRELELLAKKTGNIGITPCGLPSTNAFREMYLCAMAHKQSAFPSEMPEVDTSIRAIVGCPYPPLWKDDLPSIVHAEHASAPRFFLSATSLLAVLSSNEYLGGPNGPIGTEKMVTATLVAQKNGVTGDLETFVTFTMRDVNGTTIGTPLVAGGK